MPPVYHPAPAERVRQAPRQARLRTRLLCVGLVPFACAGPFTARSMAAEGPGKRREPAGQAPRPSRPEAIRRALRNWLTGLGLLKHRDEPEAANGR